MIHLIHAELRLHVWLSVLLELEAHTVCSAFQEFAMHTYTPMSEITVHSGSSRPRTPDMSAISVSSCTFCSASCYVTCLLLFVQPQCSTEAAAYRVVSGSKVSYESDQDIPAQVLGGEFLMYLQYGLALCREKKSDPPFWRRLMYWADSSIGQENGGQRDVFKGADSSPQSVPPCLCSW